MYISESPVPADQSRETRFWSPELLRHVSHLTMLSSLNEIC